MKKIIFIALFAFSSCGNEATIENTEGISPELESKAFDNLNFGISKEEYLSKAKENYTIGTMNFKAVPSFTEKDELYAIDLMGEKFVDFDTEVYLKSMLEIQKIIIDQYGENEDYYEDDQKGIISKSWVYGKKMILMTFKYEERPKTVFSNVRFVNYKLAEENDLKIEEDFTKEFQKSKEIF